MSSLNSMYIKTKTLETLLNVLKKKKEKGIELTISINDDTNDYGQNLSAWVSQSKEQREEKRARFFIGNGKCFWTDGTIVTAAKKEEAESKQTNNTDEESDDLPF